MSIQIMASNAQFSAYVRTGHHEDALAYLPNGSLGLGYYPSGSCKSCQGGLSNDMMVSDPKIDGWYFSAALAATTCLR